MNAGDLRAAIGFRLLDAKIEHVGVVRDYSDLAIAHEYAASGQHTAVLAIVVDENDDAVAVEIVMAQDAPHDLRERLEAVLASAPEMQRMRDDRTRGQS